MKVKTLNKVFQVLLTLFVLFVGYGLFVLYDSDVYFFGLEISTLAIVSIFSLFVIGSNEKTEESGMHLKLIFYKKFVNYALFGVIVGTLIGVITGTEISAPNQFLYYLLPILVIFLSIDMISNMYAFERKTSVSNMGKFVSYMGIPFIFLSLIAILGEYLNVGIRLLFVIALLYTIIMDIVIIKLYSKEFKA